MLHDESKKGGDSKKKEEQLGKNGRTTWANVNNWIARTRGKGTFRWPQF